MRGIAFAGAAALSVLLSMRVHAGAMPGTAQVGDAYEIRLTRDSENKGSQGSSGNSHDTDSIIERVISLRDDGLELQYELPQTATPDQKTIDWQFPARIFKPFNGAAQLLNGPELESRVDSWLKAADLPRTACGHWIFTWTAIQIQCDPQSVLKLIQQYDLRSEDLREGAPYRPAEALAPGELARRDTPDGRVFTVEMPVDPDVVRRAHAESDVVLGELMRKPVTLDAALQERAKEIVTGIISVAIETDLAGNVRRRTKVTKLDIATKDGHSESQSTTETVERRLISERH